MKTLSTLVVVLITVSRIAGQDCNVDALWDYTKDSKATKTLIAGAFFNGLDVMPQTHSPATILTQSTGVDLNTKIDWRVTSDFSKQFGPGAIACYDEPNVKRQWNAYVIFKDLNESNAKTIKWLVGEKLSAGLNRFYLIYTDPSQATQTRVFECTSRDQFEDTWEKVTGRSDKHRFILTQNMTWLAKVPPNAEESRCNLVQKYLTESAPLVTQLSEKQQSSVIAATTYKKKTNELFEHLNSTVVIDDKLKSYELYWYAKSSQLGVNGNYNIEIDLNQFRQNLFEATKNTKCTVKVFTTNGTNAVIQVAKQDRKFKWLGTSVVTTELERASYYFQAWRNGKLTGETSSPVDCTGKSRDILITEK